MAPKFFVTGATGYIGGDALFHLTHKYPDLDLALLVRSEDKAKTVQSKYPNARIVLGSLDDSDIIRREAAWADIVLHTADSSDHEGSAKAISKGLVEGHSPSRPGYWLHVGGTGILTYFDSVKKTFGEPDEKVFNDLEGVDELVNLPDDAFHRNVDKIVLEAGAKHSDRVKTAVVCPPTIYGKGRGPVSGRGRQVYELTSFILKEKYCPRIGRGLSRWNNIHVYDLSSAIGLLAEAALDPSRKDDSQIWGPRGYFLTENGEHTWSDLAVQIGREVCTQGLASGELELKELSMDEAVKSSAGFEAASWGMNSRAKALRAKKFLGWQPVEHGLIQEIPTIVKSEAARLG
ncbi:nucleoside-diphosphate-sugar epimerase [Colletotrichum truncatum]|uniref:Nucleoside-diphosphate-sugar epimerase n=1 Tax=Colletotrichum truncatum TaxID=5467 RepID=A0ACC3YT28_COLTU|nr:nucleoside-diphosphate-sugar epimerase [Colletotrichum truncatum]KAF6785072.1 nucleoside-diphosphate-sugar epimerase [Colletotrichum truncatum]